MNTPNKAKKKNMKITNMPLAGHRVFEIVIIIALASFFAVGTSSGKVLFLAHFNGSNGDADYAVGSNVDESGYSAGTTASGKWGKGLDLTNGGSPGCWYDGLSNLDPNKGTVDFWYCIDEDAAGMYHPMFGWYNMPSWSGQPKDTGFEFYSKDSLMTFGLFAPYDGSGIGGFNVDLGNWHHIEINWDCTGGDGASEYTLYMDGQLLLRAVDKIALQSAGGKITVGIWDYSHGHFLHGRVDELRITDQVEHTSNFTPPAGEYTTPGTPAHLAGSYSDVTSMVDDLENNIGSLTKAIQISLWTAGSADASVVETGNKTIVAGTIASIASVGKELRQTSLGVSGVQDEYLGQLTILAASENTAYESNFDIDDDVDLIDISWFAGFWNRDDCDPCDFWDCGRTNLDNSDTIINLQDLAIVLENYLSDSAQWPFWFTCWDWPTQCHGDTDSDVEGNPGYYRVGNTDLAVLQAAMGTQYGDPNYTPCADFDRNGYIDQDDQNILDVWFQQSDVPADCQKRN